MPSDMKIFKLILAILICIASVVLTQQIVVNAIENQKLKTDSAEINHIKYGLFSVNQWKAKLTQIVISEINKAKLTSKNEAQLKKHLEAQLDVLIDKVDEKIKESNKETTKGKMKQFLIDKFVDMDKIKEGIPEYADAMLAEIKKKETQKELKGMVKQQVRTYLSKTFEKQDVSKIERIIEETGATNIEEARVILDDQIRANEHYTFQLCVVLILIISSLFIIEAFSRQPVPAPQFIIMVLTLLMLLTTGVTTPMIDLDARVSKMAFVLLDHPIEFTNQVLYFQSKSITNVFGIMIAHKDIEMKAVGILMVMFSIVFPVLKLLSSLGYYYSEKLRNSKVIQFFVLKSGKWSMADVLVIAIFMAYIGFNGMISNQFDKFSNLTDELEFMTTNGTALQAGFYTFFAYVILALFLTGFLAKRNEKNSSKLSA